MQWLVAIVVAFWSIAAQARWLEARSTNFIVYSEGSEGKLRSFTDKVERYDQLLRLLNGIKEPPTGVKLKIYLLPSTGAIANFYTGDARNVAGFYTTRLYGPVAFVPRTEGDSVFDLDGQTILFHEYAHHFMMQNYPVAFPAWFIEGFAEYFSTVEFPDDVTKVDIGKVVNPRIPSLALNQWAPMEKLLALNYQAESKISSTEIEQLYAQGWLLTHYLYNSKERAGQLGTYIRNLNKGLPEADAFRAAFQTDYATLGKELKRYFQGGKLYYQRLSGLKSTAGVIEVRPLTPPEDALLVLEARLRLGVDKTRRADFDRKFNAAVKPFADTPPGRMAQAEWEIAYGTAEAATAQLAPLVAATPADPRALLLQAIATAKLADAATGGSSPAANKVARSWAVRANRAAPEAPYPLVLYYRSFLRDDVTPPQIAVDGMAEAHALMPQDSGLAMNTAVALARSGAKDDAKRLLRPLIYNPHGGSVSRTAQDLLAAIDSGKLMAVSFSDSPDEGP